MIISKTLTVLFVLTSHSMMGDTDKKTGAFLEEIAVPYYEFINSGYNVEIVSIAGGDVPLDPGGVTDIKSPESKRFLKDKEAMKKIVNTKSIDTVNPDKYDAIFLPGGHGTMWDLPNSKKLGEIIAKTLSDNKVVAAVCHGPAGLVNAKFADGTSVVKGKKVSAFTDSEEKAIKLDGVVPFMLETRLRELGAIFKSAPNWAPIAVEDNNLITGQNPASSKMVADLVIKNLKNKK